MGFLTPVWSYVDALVHPSARTDALTAARHRAFIVPRLLGSFAALAAFPLYLVVRGTPSALEVAAFGWLIAPISIAYFLSRTGRLETAQVLSAASIGAVATAAAWWTGGINSWAAIGLALVPFEGALSLSRRIIALTCALALACAMLLLAATVLSLVPRPPAGDPQHAIAALGVVLAALVTTALALGVGSLLRASAGLISAEADRFRLLAAHTADVVARHGRNGAVTYISPAAESLFGVPPGELLGHRLFDRVHVADRPAYLSALSEAASSRQSRSVEFRVRSGGENARGHFIWVEMRCQPADASGKREDVAALLRDIGERKRREEALQIARADAERASAAKTRFLATVSHELRTPLNAIIGFSDMLADDAMAADEDRRRDYLRMINESGRHLLSVVNGILDMSKIESGAFAVALSPFAPAAAVSACCDMLALKARECGVELRMRIDDDLPEIAADRRAVDQILINLISNAIKFTPRGGRVAVGASAENRNLVLTIQDTGIGIDEQDLPRLGEAFFQAHDSYDRRYDGVGLGLSIVKGLVRLHDGDMDIRSRPGEGTQVTVCLPLVHANPSPATPIELARRRARAADFIPTNNQVRKSA
ncbi:MAG TPA: PAS domain-containing sensor histidine kinase [Pseudolabrys sp.]|nr:PAS domain-containing sensor histidine kinase [Pseudolabrys sp.]